MIPGKLNSCHAWGLLAGLRLLVISASRQLAGISEEWDSIDSLGFVLASISQSIVCPSLGWLKNVGLVGCIVPHAIHHILGGRLGRVVWLGGR